MAEDIALIPAPHAPSGRGDVTRRWALRWPDGAVRFAGVTRTEGAAAARGIARIGPPAGRALVQVALPALLSEGAGPHLLDAEGRLVIALGPHPHLAGRRVAMSEPRPRHRIGLIEQAGAGLVWRWRLVADVSAERRVAALDALDACADEPAARAWQARWGQPGGEARGAGGADH